ncbi:hypothetical protein [Persicirhabdus sediminis]|uniref:Uncharacterized protein n=1 Tax=Persicirhabdus sediminis TaxID=454144 RepID=A0A8J7MAP6_9BACT|nr:hypothetical protein [Persicirhabdus sediminis]MBK1790044.1 hypothetical protein [Persicirhabdus sediminis]
MNTKILLALSLAIVSCKDDKEPTYLKSSTSIDYHGPLRLVCLGRDLSSYHICVFDEEKASRLSVTEKYANITDMEARTVAQMAIEDNLPLYASGASVLVVKLPLEPGFIHLVYFKKKVPYKVNIFTRDEVEISTVIPVYADKSAHIPEGL